MDQRRCADDQASLLRLDKTHRRAAAYGYSLRQIARCLNGTAFIQVTLQAIRQLVGSCKLQPAWFLIVKIIQRRWRECEFAVRLAIMRSECLVLDTNGTKKTSDL